MKNHLWLLLYLLTQLPMFSQTAYRVTAPSGLVVRTGAGTQQQRVGKIPFNALVEMLETSRRTEVIHDGGDLMRGNWVKIRYKNKTEELEGFVFDGFLKSINREPEGYFELSGQSLSLVTDAYKIQIDSLFFSPKVKKIVPWSEGVTTYQLDLAEYVEHKSFRVDLLQSGQVEIYQRIENSLVVSADGPHCDLVDWKHYTSAWQYVPILNGRTQVVAPRTEDWGQFIEVEIDEVKKAVEKECGDWWAEHIKAAKAATDYPLGVSMSRLYLKILFTDAKSGVVGEKILAFSYPLGC